ncbi:MAG: hypothetical protein A3F68_09060 [Acidobacteria bacterium RIFCSPLOWO2_12_FULL_54_10]|nr:MAG: hypothetical protein A3F68_09060 [Acidobacteria bacterium RIFCSPLOWO2_12_FULL_54_10]
METNIPFIHLKSQYASIREEVEAGIHKVLERQSFILGDEVKEMEELIARLHNCAHGVGCASGSDALLLSLLALGIGPGDKVIVPSFTFFATAGSVVRAGATPVFVDIDPRTMNISPSTVEQALADHDQKDIIKAIIPVHLYGQCADMDRLLSLAKQHSLPVVEDAAQSILARYGGRPAGSMGNCGCLSFFPTKNLGGAGDGGMILTNDSKLAELLHLLRDHGARERNFHILAGINSRLDTLQAAVLLTKAKHLPGWTEQRQQKAAFYQKLFLGAGICDPDAVYPTAKFPVVLPYTQPGNYHVFNQYTLRVARRKEMADYLASHGIGTAIYYPLPLHRQPVFSCLNYANDACPESERAASEVLSIPIYPELSDEQQAQVTGCINKFYSSR